MFFQTSERKTEAGNYIVLRTANTDDTNDRYAVGQTITVGNWWNDSYQSGSVINVYNRGKRHEISSVQTFGRSGELNEYETRYLSSLWEKHVG